MVLIEAMQQKVGHSSVSMVAGPILEECRIFLVGFGKVVLEHCNRDSNMVAHVLAQNGCVDRPNL